MTIIVGVDPAAARLDAVSLYPDGSFRLHTQRKMPSDIVERCVFAQRWMEGIVKAHLQEDTDVVVGVEEPVLGRRERVSANGTLPLTRVQGCLLAGASRAGARLVLQVNNRRWKKRIVGNGNAQKPQVSAWVRKYWRALYMQAKGRQDTCDAACIALEVREVMRLRRKMEATRRRAMLRRR